jgi:hypothetical protein
MLSITASLVPFDSNSGPASGTRDYAPQLEIAKHFTRVQATNCWRVLHTAFGSAGAAVAAGCTPFKHRLQESLYSSRDTGMVMKLFFNLQVNTWYGARVTIVVKALYYKPESRGFETR